MHGPFISWAISWFQFCLVSCVRVSVLFFSWFSFPTWTAPFSRAVSWVRWLCYRHPKEIKKNREKAGKLISKYFLVGTVVSIGTRACQLPLTSASAARKFLLGDPWEGEWRSPVRRLSWENSLLSLAIHNYTITCVRELSNSCAGNLKTCRKLYLQRHVYNPVIINHEKNKTETLTHETFSKLKPGERSILV